MVKHRRLGRIRAGRTAGLVTAMLNLERNLAMKYADAAALIVCIVTGLLLVIGQLI